MKIRSLFINMVVLLCSFLVAFGIIEAYFRMFNPQPIRPSTYQIDPVYGLKMIPGLKGYIRTNEYIQPFQLNSLGFRDKERQRQKAKNTYRIIMLGDSFTWGCGVKESETFSRIIENILNHNSKNTRYEVFNWGVNAWGTAHEMLALKREGIGYSPDLAIICFFKGNDIEDNIYSSTFKLDEEGKLVYSEYGRQKIIGVKRITDYVPFYRFLTQHSHFVNFIRIKLLAKVEISDTIDFNESISSDILDYGIRLTEAILEEWFAFASRNKIKLALSVIPHKNEVSLAYGEVTPSERQWYSRESVMLERVCHRHNVPLLDLSGRFKQEEKAFRHVYFTVDGHLSPHGNKVTADEIENFLKTNHILD